MLCLEYHFPAMVLMMNNSGCVLNTVVIKAVFI
ncbi:hypothetical protein O209_11135 [Lactiplantibacillus plantarum WHE 92]|nr:hypothetical protein N574_14665 [Lactiplantibacillus plantarum 2165]EYR70957.1 hypothetical protein O209_11135 [Lactiplantibacillus plantarum WHE 92]CDN29711.1 hypothetical protein predicted by Glimmer/Critica [Lactiplantibacillus plantarum]